jgi:hypothetical protein
MLRSVKGLHGYSVHAKDGDMGKVYDFYFHDDTWIIRYVVVDTGHWLPGRKVLLSWSALGQPDWPALKFPVTLTREQVRNSPDIDTDRPVSRQQEVDLHNYYGWPMYWMDPGAGAWPGVAPMAPIYPPPGEAGPEDKGDPHLRSARQVTGYHIHATDGELGHVDDFIVEDTRWVIRYMVVHTGHWLPARKVLISPQWLEGFSHQDRRANVKLTRERISNCPEFHPAAGVNREYEERLYDYYGRPAYWEPSGPATKGRA